MKVIERSVNPPDGGYGWIIVLASIIINSTLTPIMQCFGIIFEDHFQELNISGAEISFLLHFQSSIMCSLGLFTGILLKTYSFRTVAMCGCITVCLGITLTSLCQSYGYLIFSIGALIGIGQGVIMPATALATSVYFKKRLTFAMTISVTGVGLLPIVMPHICHYFLNSYGLKGTILLFSAISFHSFIGAVLLRPLQQNVKCKLINKTPKSVPKNEKEQPLMLYNETTTPKDESKLDNRLHNLFCLFNLELFRERAYVIILIGMGISYVAELNFILMMPFVLSELAGFTRADVALTLSIQAAADITGRLLIPTSMHKVGWSSKIMYALSLLGSCVGRTVLALFCGTKSVVLFSAVIIGLSKGSKAVYQSLILPNYISLNKLPSAMGFLMVINGLLSFVVGPIIGGIHDLTHSYFYALHTATMLSLACVFLWLFDYFLIASKVKTVETEEEV